MHVAVVADSGRSSMTRRWLIEGGGGGGGLNFSQSSNLPQWLPTPSPPRLVLEKPRARETTNTASSYVNQGLRLLEKNTTGLRGLPRANPAAAIEI